MAGAAQRVVTERAGHEQHRPGRPQLDRLVGQRHTAHAAGHHHVGQHQIDRRSEEHTSELQSLMRISYAVFCLKKKKTLSHSTYSHLEQANAELLAILRPEDTDHTLPQNNPKTSKV